ncbi:MAG: hypothetical protein K9J81_01920 [Desulfohalobiaceae bacterium]|nr:hypothetical protein [Desulfohalobiaceae bacterium]
MRNVNAQEYFFYNGFVKIPGNVSRFSSRRGQQAVDLECTHAARVVNIEQALCRDHFADLLQAANWRAVLDLVNAQTARFFPFSYR